VAENVIEVRGLGKKYRLGQQQAAYGSLRESLSPKFRKSNRTGGSREDFWALRDVDLDVREGEALGIIGTNGAGKSTLLKILSRITEPSVGMARTRGRVGVLLEVGTGFHPELTGRENVYLSGAVMGMTRREVRRHFDEIVAFSGVERFLETPLKRYSSGMQLRLAFAVAAHLEPELMLVDEVLAVGDVEFQRRCLQRMNRLSEEGRTVLFVSHDLGAISRLCSRAILISKGRVAEDGEPAGIIQSYYSAIMGEAGQAEFDVDQDVGLKHVAIVDDGGDLLPQPTRGEPFHVRARVVASGQVSHVEISMQVYASDGSVVLDEAWADQEEMPQLLSGPGEYVVDLRVPQLLPSGDYILGLWLGSVHKTYFHREALRFSVQPHVGDRQEWLTRRRVVQPEVAWSRERADGDHRDGM
jgi:ABC-type polysaccharide/polyol phosphate transport system ATPase subunit